MSTIAMYYFQGDLGESMEYPNAFVIPNTSKPTLGTFLKYFPTHEKGQLHFRFRVEDSSCEYVWLDITNNDEILPFYQESIMAKVLRTDEALTLKRKSILRRKNMEALSSNIVNGGAATFSRGADVPPAAPKRPERPTSTSNVSKNAYEREVYSDEPPTSASSTSTSAKQTPASVPKPPRPDSQKNTQNFESDEPSQSSAKHVSASSSAKIPAPSVPVSDMLDFDDGPAPSPTPSAASAGMGSAKVSNANLDAMMDLDSTPTPNRAELKASKAEKINDQVKKALEEKQELDRKADQEQNDFDSARAQHDQKLLSWSTNNKERRNIRSLLSTMHTVLWPESRWKTIGLGDLLEPRQVKLQYRKAMLVVHPDHNVNLPNEHKYIAKRVFEAVNEAYNEFTTKESV